MTFGKHKTHSALSVNVLCAVWFTISGYFVSRVKEEIKDKIDNGNAINTLSYHQMVQMIRLKLN